MGPEATISVRSLQNKKSKKNNALAKVAAVANDELDRALTIDGNVAKSTALTLTHASSSRTTANKFSWAEAVVYGEVVNTNDKKLQTNANNVSKTLKYERRTAIDTRPSLIGAHSGNTTYKFDDLDFPPMGESFIKNTPKKLQLTVATKETNQQTEKVPTPKSCDKQMISNEPKYDTKDMWACLLEPSSPNMNKKSPGKGLGSCVTSTSATSISTDESRTQLLAEPATHYRQQRPKAGSGNCDKTPTKTIVQICASKPLSTVTSSSSVSTSSTSRRAQRETYAQVMQSSSAQRPTTPTQCVAAAKPNANASRNLFSASSSSTTCAWSNAMDRQSLDKLNKVKSSDALARIDERSVETRISCIAKQFDDASVGVDNWFNDVIPPSGTTDRSSLRKRRRNRRSKRMPVERNESGKFSPLNDLLKSPKSDDLLEFPPLPKQNNHNMLDMSMRSNMETLNGAGDTLFSCEQAKKKPSIFESNLLFADDEANNVSSGIEHFSFLQSPDEDEIPFPVDGERCVEVTEIGDEINQMPMDGIESALEGSNIKTTAHVRDETKSFAPKLDSRAFDSKQSPECVHLRNVLKAPTTPLVESATQQGSEYMISTESIGDSLCVNINQSLPIETNVQVNRTSRRKRRRPRRRNVLRQNAALSSLQAPIVSELNGTPTQAPPAPAQAPPTPQTPLPNSNFQSNYVYVPTQAQNNSNQQQQQVVPIVYETFFQQQQYQQYYQQQQQQQQQQVPTQQTHMHIYPYQQQPQNQLPIYTVSSVMQSNNAGNANPMQSIQQYVVAQPYMLQNPPNGAPTPIYTQQGPILLSSQMTGMPMRRTTDLNASALPSTINGSNTANNMLTSPIFDTQTQQMLQTGELYNTNSCSINTASSYVQSPIFTMSSQSSFMQLDHDLEPEWQNEREQQHDQQQQQQAISESVFSLTPPVCRPRVNNSLSSIKYKKTRQYRQRKSVYMQAAAASADVSTVCSVHTQTTTETSSTTNQTNENNLMQLFQSDEQQSQTSEEAEEAARILSQSQRAMLASRSYVVQSQVAIMKRRSAQAKLHMQSPEVAFYSQMAPFLENVRKEVQFTTMYRPVKHSDSILDLNLLPPSIKKLYEIVTPRYSEYAFVYALSAQLCQERVPMDSYVYFKMSLLLSLASFEDKPESNRPPISLMVICYDTYMANYLLNTVGELAKRFVGPYDDVRPPVHVNTARFTWNEANPVMLAQGGVYYAGNWKRVKVPSADTLLKFVENSTVNSDRSEKDYPLETAIWSHWHPEDGPELETFHKFFKVFGLPIFMEDDIDEVIMNYILHQYRVQVFESSTDFLSIPLEEMRQFLAMIAKQQVSFSADATNLLQKYFVVTRLVRPNVLSKQTYVVLKQFAESFAKLSLRREVFEIDVVSAIFLCETFIQHIYGRSDIPPPDFVTFNYIAMVDSYMNVFYNWLKFYLNNESAKKRTNSSNDDDNDKRTRRDCDENMPFIDELFENAPEAKTSAPTQLDLD